MRLIYNNEQKEVRLTHSRVYVCVCVCVCERERERERERKALVGEDPNTFH